MAAENNKKNKLVSDKNNTYFTENRIMRGSSIPTEGTYLTGDIIINDSATSVDEPMWICNEGGTPGKWSSMTGTGSTIVPSYASMMQSKATLGSLFYVLVDEADDENPGFYVVTGVKEVDGKKVPSTVDKINKKESAVPTLTYDASMPEGTRIYLKDDEELIIRFNFSSNTYGDGKYRVYRDGSLIKSWSGAKGNVIANLGPITTDGTYEITVTATDYLTIPAPETLTFKVIVGGLKVSSTFDETLLTAIYEEGDAIEFPYTASLADASQRMKLKVNINNNSTGVVEVEDIVELEGTHVNNIWISPIIESRGLYTITAQAYTGEHINDLENGAFVSNKVEYVFRVLAENEIAIIDESKDIQINSNMYFSVPFRIVSKIADYFVMRGEIYKDVDGKFQLLASTPNAGISSRVNVTNYWSIGKLEQGTYKYILKAYTVDGLVESLEAVEKIMTVVESTYQKVPYIDNANLIAYFDANTKRNNDGSPSIWQNSAKTGDKYRIRLHGLNYTSNGWKHIDESLLDEDDGEIMLKFTGESYGEMVEVTNGIEKPYSPLGIFKMGGQQGFTFETAIRTRNIGELNARVVSCMKGDSLNDPGVAISYDTMAIGSDSQVNSLEFNENEWVHITLVVDNNIRSFEQVGQAMIEDVNPAKTLRVYINGVLCSCTTLSDKETFLDGSKQAYPLVLNACRMIDAAGNISFANFGECEIKFIRIYNSYLKSSEVLQNFISHIYDPEEQQHKNDKNNVDLATLPTIVFKRKPNPDNSRFATLHSIKDKATSKKTFVDCVMEYDDGAGNIFVYDNIDVYLQGTSSLQYPVKNYKIKSWVDQEKTTKLKFVPPNMEGEWVDDSTYTLKCDYMEQSHKNNTPTARFYNQVIDALGGESPAKRAGYHDAIDGFPCIVYYNEGDSDSENVLVGSFMFNIDKEGKELGFECKLYDENGEVIGSGKDSCISYEATANASDTAGCFYKLEESIENVYKYYLEDSYKEYLEKYGLTAEKFTMDQFKAGIADGSISYFTFEEFVQDYDEIDYIMDDFEARYTFNEDDDKATYRPMVDLVNWVSDSIKAGTFKKDFEAHLDLNYTMAYYLQMQVFTQVDNCGKNSMWDTWDGVKFYPRPYDMDTQMGLSNTGTEIIRVDSEILADMSPTKVEGTFAGYEYIDTTTDLRYMNYNTRTSKLWNAFAEEFKEEIKKAYTKLRNSGVYSFENIYSTISADTDEKIGEIYFNKDAASKYLSQTNETDSTYLKMLHGNRAQKYKKFLKERLIFLDTVYEYMQSDAQPDTLNSEISLRSDAAYGQGEGTTVRCYLGISTYSPQYVTVNVGSGADAVITAYVGPESRYKDPDTGIEYEGTLFSFPIRGINKEFRITGASNIKRINRLQSLNLTEAVIEKATKILELDFSYSNRMAGLKVGNNTYLRYLNCTNSYLLGTATESQTLDLSNCKNLKTVDISYTKFTGITFPKDTVLNSINLTGSSIKNVSIDGAEFLTDIKITGCDNINKFELNRCNKINTVNVANSTIQNFIVTNCNNVTSVDLSGCKSIAGFDVTNSYNIVELNMSGNTSSIMKDLKLYSMYNLRKLIVSQSATAHTIRLPKYLNEAEAFKAANGESALLWNTLEYLDLSTCGIQKIQYGSADVEDVVLDMSQLDKLTTLKLSNSTYFTEIRSINYTGDLTSLFNQCKGLKKITGKLTNATASINSMFQMCYELNDIDGLTFNFTGVTSANSTCDRCYRMKTPMLKKILYACGPTLTSASGMCHMSELDGYTGILGTGEDTTRTIPSDLFTKNTSLQNVSGFFDCVSGYTTVPGDLFDPFADTLTTCSTTFSRMNNLTTVGSNLLHNKPKLNTTQNMFAYDGKLRDYINNYPNIFLGSPNITTTFGMFRGCTELAVGEEGLGEMFYPLTNLTNCAIMFYGCSNNLNCEIPDGLLSKNNKLVKISGMFQSCRKLPKLPRSLFRVNIGDTNKLPDLTKAVGVFGDCTSMKGEVDSTFFLGAENLVNIGMDHEDNDVWSNVKITSRGFFEGTGVTGYHETFLNVVPKVNNVSGMFKNCTQLAECLYYKGNEVLVHNNTVSEDLFKSNPVIQVSHQMFYGCTSLEGHIPASLFEPCKKIISAVDSMFNGCTNLSGMNLDAGENDESVTGISKDWFSGATNLVSVSYFLNGCNMFNGSIPEGIFEGCSNLQNTAYFLGGCKGITGAIPLTLFDACREKLNNVSGMFSGCEGLNEPIPVGEYRTVQGIVSYTLVSGPTVEGALQVVEKMSDPFTQVSYADVVTLSPNLATVINASGNYYVTADIGDKTEVIKPGLLADCINLTTAAALFNACKKIPGAIPHDLFFTSTNASKFTKLTSIDSLFKNCEKMDKVYLEEETGMTYICNPNLFEKCTALTNCASVFNRMYAIPNTCQVHPLTFSKQTKVTTVYELFMGTKVTGAVSPLLFSNCINTLTDASKMFCFTNVTSVGSTFLNNGGKNTKLKTIYGLFYGCSNLEGASPEFWNGAKFTAMGGGDSNGYAGALARCTRLSNYNAAQAVDKAWTADQPIYL